jgi:hypothetical protein
MIATFQVRPLRILESIRLQWTLKAGGDEKPELTGSRKGLGFVGIQASASLTNLRRGKKQHSVGSILPLRSISPRRTIIIQQSLDWSSLSFDATST